jgi:hypothetical protein
MVIDIIQQALKGPEKKYIYISFQNILNNHYDTVFEIIYSFKDITLKDVKEFKVFQVKEMPQDLEKITFSNKYKQAVDKFYKLLSENSCDKFCDLLDTLPHEKKSAIFLLKLKLRCRKMIGGGITDIDDDDVIENAKKKGMTTRNMMRILYAFYASTMDVFIILGDNALKTMLKIDVPLESGSTNKFWDAQKGGLHGQTLDDKYMEAVRPFADKLSANVIKYFSEVNESILKTEGFKQLIGVFSPENIGAYVNEIGMSVAVDTFVPFETLKLTSDVIEFLALQTTEMSYDSEIVKKSEEKKIRKGLDVYKNNLEIFLKEIQELLCLIKERYPSTTVDEILAHEMKREGLEMNFECPIRGGNKLTQQLEKMQNTINNKKTNETLLEEELYYIVVLTSNNKNLTSAIDSTDGASLHELKKKNIKITRDYNSFKIQFEKFRELISSDRILAEKPKKE